MRERAFAPADDAVRPRTLAELAKSHAFAEVTSEFTKAVRIRVIELRHAAVILAHVHRFPQPYDECGRFLADALRDVAVQGDEGDMVATVVIDALREAHTLYLDGKVPAEDQLLALARQLGSAIVVRGPHLSIAKRIDSDALVRIHLDTIADAIAKGAAVDADADESPAPAFVLFKALGLMLAGITGREALTISTKMDALILGAGFATIGGRPLWDPQRAYAKRLATAMSKDPTIKRLAGAMGPPAVPPKRKRKPEVKPITVRHNPRPSRNAAPLPQADKSSPEKRAREEGEEGDGERAKEAAANEDEAMAVDDEGEKEFEPPQTPARQSSPALSDGSAPLPPPKRQRIV